MPHRKLQPLDEEVLKELLAFIASDDLKKQLINNRIIVHVPRQRAKSIRLGGLLEAQAEARHKGVHFVIRITRSFELRWRGRCSQQSRSNSSSVA